MSEIRALHASNQAVTTQTALHDATSTDLVSGGPRRGPAGAVGTPATRAARLSRRERRRRDQDEILTVYEAHHRDLVRFASLVAPEPAMAEDLVHEAFVKLYTAWRRIEDPNRVAGYLRSTVLNLARGRARRLGVIRRNRPEPRPDVASAESHAVVNSERDRVVAALRHLSDRQRACLVLRHYEDRSESEIAEILGISIGSVRTHIHRGMQSLTAIFEEPDNERA